MKIGDYNVSRHDERNLMLTRDDRLTATHDTKHHNAGDEYLYERFIGYYGDIGQVCQAILKAESRNVDKYSIDHDFTWNLESYFNRCLEAFNKQEL